MTFLLIINKKKIMSNKCIIILMFMVLLVVSKVEEVASLDYGDALRKCIVFFEGQRSGKLPPTQRVAWRKDSALTDGSDAKMDLVGGYYDAGDNVKFSFPMAFSTTLLAWSVIEFGKSMDSQELGLAREAIRWSTDYFLKASSVPNQVVAQVGDPNFDHNCWERPEYMDTLRTTYIVNRTHPGSEVSGEIAAALAASSIVFKASDPLYSKSLLNRAVSVFQFADKYRGSYNSSVKAGACPFYCDYNGYQDELLWGGAWLAKATGDHRYWNYVTNNSLQSPPTVTRIIDGLTYQGSSFAEFGWDVKNAGINILVAPWAFNTPYKDKFIPDADKFICSILPESPTKSVDYTPGGLLMKPGGSNLQHATALSLITLIYAQFLKSTNSVVRCGKVVADPARLVNFARSQTDYILGNNPMRMSYMVGYGRKFPQRIHHRGSSIPTSARHLTCGEGFSKYFKRGGPNPNVLVGAVVGGPDKNDQFADDRGNAPQSEPTTYINAPFVGVLAFFKSPTFL